MPDSLDAALDALERSAEHPSTLSVPFVEMFPITGAAVSTVGSLIGSETVSASDAVAAELDELQFDLGEGPCWDAMNSGQPVLEPTIRSNPRTRWPAFTPALDGTPVNSLFAFPLRLGTLRIGAVDLYSVHPVELDATQTRQASTMAQAVSRHVLRRALDEIGGDYDDTGNAYSRRLIHQATGVVLAQLRLPPEDARLVPQGHAFATNRSMMEVAQDVLDRKLNFAQGASGIESSS